MPIDPTTLAEARASGEGRHRGLRPAYPSAELLGGRSLSNGARSAV